MSSKPTIAKQIMGALGGAAIALVAYSAYEIAVPHLTALTSVPQSRTIPSDGMYFRSAADELDQEYYDRVAQRTRQIVQELGQNEGTRDISETYVSDPTKSRGEQYMDAVTQPTAVDVPLPVQQHTPPQQVVQQNPPSPEQQPTQENAEVMRAQVMQQEVQHMPAEGLPDSGIGAWILAFVACAAAGVRHVRKGAHA